MALDMLSLAKKYAAPKGGVSASEPMVHVDEVASQVAALYEKVRNVVDYREEHLLRKHFIERAYSRNLVLHGEAKIALPLIKDLIRAGHLKNDTVPERKVADVQELVDRSRLLRVSLSAELAPERRRRIEMWLEKIAVQAVEEHLFPPLRDSLVAETALRTLKDQVVVHGPIPDQEKLSLAVFLGVQRAILRADDEQIRFRVFEFLEPGWRTADPEELKAISLRLPDLRKRLNRSLKDPIQESVTRFVSKHAVIFHVLGDAVKRIEQDDFTEAALRDEQEFEPYLKKAYEKRFAGEKKKLRRFAILSVSSFFLTKIAFALALEIPLQKYVLHDFSVLNTILNVVIPPVLLLIAVAAIEMPGRKNAERVMEEAAAVAFGKKREYVLKLPKKGEGAGFGAEMFYGLMFLVSFGLVSWGLNAINFNPADIIIFILFTSLVAATSVRVYNRANQLSLTQPKRGILSLIGDALILPFVATGGVIIRGISKFNIFIIATDLLIDLPFQVFVSFVENVSDFLRGKKEGVA